MGQTGVSAPSVARLKLSKPRAAALACASDEGDGHLENPVPITMARGRTTETTRYLSLTAHTITVGSTLLLIAKGHL